MVLILSHKALMAMEVPPGGQIQRAQQRVVLLPHHCLQGGLGEGSGTPWIHPDSNVYAPPQTSGGGMAFSGPCYGALKL